MRKFFVVMFLFVIPCALAFTWTWNHYPNLFPTIPQSLALRLVDLYGAESQEQVADMEILLGFAVGLVIFGLLGQGLFRKKID